MTDLENLLELLREWMDANRRSPLDGTISCRLCAALVLESNAERHTAWHEERGEWVW